MYKPIPAPEGHVVHKGCRLELRLVDLPVGGDVIQKELVVHRGAVIILPLLDDDKVVLIRNFRVAVGEELWELPAGTLAAGEAPEACALRELKEETGYQASSIELLGTFFNAPGWSTYRLFAFVARGLTAGQQELERDESIQVHIIPLAEVCSMIACGEIMDGKTISAFAIHAARHGIPVFGKPQP